MTTATDRHNRAERLVDRLDETFDLTIEEIRAQLLEYRDEARVNRAEAVRMGERGHTVREVALHRNADSYDREADLLASVIGARRTWVLNGNR